MLVILEKIVNGYTTYFEDTADKRVDHLFLMGSPLKIILVTLAYWMFVKQIAPRYMKNREPYELRTAMQAFNILQIVFNSFLVWKIFPILFTDKDYSTDWSCMRSNRNGTLTIAYCSYVYFILKVSDYMDTIFMVLRKRFRQVTFLHVYHHILMTLSAYYAVRYTSGGHPILLGVLNCAVHAVMYLYYFLCALEPELKKSLWWKKHITHFQLVQFAILLTHFARALLNPNCDQSRPLMWFCAIQSFVMMILFTNFYIKTYIQGPKVKSA